MPTLGEQGRIVTSVCDRSLTWIKFVAISIFGPASIDVQQFTGRIPVRVFPSHVVPCAVRAPWFLRWHEPRLPAPSAHAVRGRHSASFCFPAPCIFSGVPFRGGFFLATIGFYRLQGLFFLLQFLLCQMAVGWCRRRRGEDFFAGGNSAARHIAVADFSAGFTFVNRQRRKGCEEEGKQ